ncbi:MAG: DUF4294 domain-containing protein [Bacteroidia bacterium]|nr:DUF4294 domain-containing protein [Bacteroidia bacterium]MDW8335287.1 DUF4294 domain-containing protein [Bacteroidia bacterium]
MSALATALMLWGAACCSAQDTAVKTKKFRKAKDGIPVVHVNTVYIVDKASKKALRLQQKRKIEYNRLRRNVELVYPLAKKCAAVINDINAKLAVTPNERERDKYLDRLEKELFERYQGEITQLTVTQGKILIKLIHRETGSRAYDLIEEYKSKRSAGMWQLVAKVFGTDLKLEYDPNKEAHIEAIVRELEAGKLNDFKVIYH